MTAGSGHQRGHPQISPSGTFLSVLWGCLCSASKEQVPISIQGGPGVAAFPSEKLQAGIRLKSVCKQASAPCRGITGTGPPLGVQFPSRAGSSESYSLEGLAEEQHAGHRCLRWKKSCSHLLVSDCVGEPEALPIAGDCGAARWQGEVALDSARVHPTQDAPKKTSGSE